MSFIYKTGYVFQESNLGRMYVVL